ncbi:MAG TPA: Fic family protein [Stellaceae bacterium]|nr:Fic family protein [Stellaceae bacterium]
MTQGREIDRLRRKKQQLDQLRPLSPRSLAALAAWYDVELTYSSNAIEGNTLTRSETAIVLEKGITIGGKPLKDHLEAIGHRDALAFVRTLAAAGEPLREIDIREIHRLILAQVDPEEAGRYSRHQRMIAGSPLVLPSPAEIPALMGDFTAWLGAAPAGCGTAFAAHARFVAIHPFSDANGRTARLLMNLLLMQAGYPPIVIGPEHRSAYIDALQALQLRGDAKPYQRFMIERLDASLDHHLAMLRPTAGTADHPEP